MMMSPELTMAFTSWETRARNFKPEVVVLEEDLLPQEIKIKASRTQAAKPRTVFFKQATPKVMIKKDLDAKPRIITERLGRYCMTRRSVSTMPCSGCKTHSHLVFSMQDGVRFPHAAH
jgi:hypothetical protein